MSNEVKFVFSTRFLGKGYAFATSEDFDSSSSIKEYLIKRFWGDDDRLWGAFKTISSADNAAEEFKKAFQQDVKVFCFNDPGQEEGAKTLFLNFVDEKGRDSLTSFFLKQGIVGGSHLGDFNGNNIEEAERFAARFKYFVIKKSDDNNNEDGDNKDSKPIVNVYAVSHLGRGDREWIEALVKEKFDRYKDSNYSEKELYLVLHDNDVPGFASTPYKYLTAQEIFKLLNDDPNSKIERDADGEEAYYLADGRKLCIIVFQHTWNDVVSLLTRSNSTYDEIKNGLMIGNRKSLREFFASDYFSSLGNPDFSKLNPDYSVDSCNNSLHIENNALVLESPTSKGNRPNFNKIRIYSDNNGALLTELMHVRTNVDSSKVLRNFIAMLRAPSHIDERKEGEVNKTVDLKKMSFPLIIKTYKNFFVDWEDAVDDEKKKEIRKHLNKKALDDNLKRVFSFFNNSSIFVRLVDIRDNKAADKAVAEFNYFDSIGLYDYDSAWENLEYKTRIFAENYLNPASTSASLNGHGDFVTPLLSGDESKALDDLMENYALVKPPLSPPQEETPKRSFWKTIRETLKELFHFKKSLSHE